MDFSWNKNQKELKKMGIEFAVNKLNENIIKRDQKSEFSHNGWKKCADFGLQGMLIPQIYGGTETDLFDMLAVLEGIGYGCKDNGLIFSINAQIWACQMPIYRFGTEKQKRKFLPALCNGKLIGANAMTEPDTGSDVYALKTTAIKKGNYYRLNGAKTFVTNAPIADIFIVYAKTGKSAGFNKISCFLVEKNTKNLSIGKNFEKMGLRTSPNSDIAFSDCEIPKENLLGKENMGAIIFSETMEWERVFILANCIGVMERQLEGCIEYANTRKLSGKPISRYQSIANKIAEMKLRLESSRMLLYKAVWLKSNNKSAALESAMAKLQLSESYIQNSRDVIQIYGGYGYMSEYALERELRDALASTIYSGTSEIQKNIIAGLSGT